MLFYGDTTKGEDVRTDSGIWQTAFIRVGQLLSGIANEFVAAIQCIAKPTFATQNYEKSAVIIQAETEDPSDYVKNVTRDLCAIDARGKIRRGNMTGRVWAQCLALEVEAGADGMAVGIEIDADNNGSFQRDVDTTTSKYGQLWVGGVFTGNRPITADVYVVRGTAGHHRVFVMREDSFMGDAGDAFMTILYAGTNKIKHQIGPDGLIIDGRKVVVRDINGQDCLVLEK